MKKKILIFSSILLLLICLALPANAANVTASVGTKIANVGETVLFTASLSDSVTVLSGGITLSYDETVLTLTEGGWSIGGDPLTEYFSTVSGEGLFFYQSATELSGSIFVASFTVKNDADFTTTPIEMNIQLKDADGSDVTVTNIPGSITVFCPHEYTKTVISDDFLKNEASCQGPAIYYYACEHCGRIGTETYPYGSATDHTYNKKVETPAYLATAGNCETPSTYYYSCVCGAKGTEIFASSAITAHDFSREIVSTVYLASAASCETPATYYKSCSCGAKGTETFTNGTAPGHTGGTATCSQRAICTRCNNAYGNLVAHRLTIQAIDERYLFLPATCTQKAMYYKICAVCGQKGNEFFEAGELLPHNYAQIYTTDAYLKSKATCASPAVYYTSCICGKKGTATFTFGPKPDHTYSTTWSKDADGHWHACTQCGNKGDHTTHIPGAAATETTAQTCTVCAYVLAPAKGHTHVYNNTWSKDANNHWHACTRCSNGNKDISAHAYDNVCDATCNTCGYVRTVNHDFSTEWFFDSEKHWFYCTICGETADEADHIPGAEATENSAQTCTECGYILQPSLDHVHNFDGAWEHDDTYHWQTCNCGDWSNMEEHSLSERVVTQEPTYEQEGSATQSCSICGLVKTETIPKLSDEAEETYEYKEFEGLDELEELDKPKKSKAPAIIAIVVTVVILAAGGTVAGIIIYRRNYW